MRRRTKARVWALQILYANEFRKEPLRKTFDLFFSEREVSEEKKAYTERLIETFEANRSDVDRMIEGSLANWRMDRLSIIDKNILRIGICEILFHPDVPGKASINEAINLSHMFGGDDSPRFVNGVLDSILHQSSRTD